MVIVVTGKTFKCGYGRCTPAWLQKLHNTKCLVCVMFMGIFAYRLCMGGIYPSIITTLEKRFDLTNTQVGVIASVNDIVGVIYIIFVCHYGERGHKGRWLAIGFLICGFGAFIFTFPQWITSPPGFLATFGDNISTSVATAPLCIQSDNSSFTDPNCVDDKRTRWLSMPFLWFLGASAIFAVGSTPILAIGTTYIDENVRQDNSPIYIVVLYSAGILGMSAGFFIGAYSIGLHGDFYKLTSAAIERVRYTPSWYGAWWVGFLVSSALSCIAFFPMLCFGRELPAKGRYRAKDENMAHGGVGNHVFGGSWSDYPKALGMFLVNPVFTLIVFRNTISMLLVTGFVTFLPLYLENVLYVTSKTAGITAGSIIAGPVLLGSLMGAAIMKRLKLSMQSILIFILIVLAVSLVSCFALLNYCPTPPFAGANVDYQLNGRDWSLVNLSDSCNQHCGCQLDDYHPVCLKEVGLVYYSPCFAGCINATEEKTYQLCSCAERVYASPYYTMEPGSCGLPSRWISRKAVVLAFLAVIFLMAGMEIAPMSQTMLRCVPFSQRTLAVGINTIVVKLLGIIPGPIIFGAALDVSCLVYRYKCNRKDICVKYDNEIVTVRLIYLAVAVYLLSMVAVTSAFLLYEPYGKKSLVRRLKDRLFRYRTAVIQPSKY